MINKLKNSYWMHWNGALKRNNDNQVIFKSKIGVENFVTDVYRKEQEFIGVVRCSKIKGFINYLVVRVKECGGKNKIYVISNPLWISRNEFKIWYPTYEEIFHLLKNGDKQYQKKTFEVIKKNRRKIN